MDYLSIVAAYMIVGCLLGQLAVRTSRFAYSGVDTSALLVAFLYMLLLWPLWLVRRLARGWRHRHPRKPKLA